MQQSTDPEGVDKKEGSMVEKRVYVLTEGG